MHKCLDSMEIVYAANYHHAVPWMGHIFLRRHARLLNLICLYRASGMLRPALSQPDGLWALPITIFGTQALGLGVNILVNVAVCPAILSCSRSQIVKIIADRRKMTQLAIMLKSIRSSWLYLRVTEDMSTKLRKEHRSATDKTVDCHSRN